MSTELEATYARAHADIVAGATKILGDERKADACAIADLTIARWRALQVASDELTLFNVLENVAKLGGAEFAQEVQKRAHKLVGVAALDAKVLVFEVLEIAIRGAAQRSRQ